MTLDVLQELTEDERAMLVRIAIAQLPARDRETVLALYYEGLTEKEACERDGRKRGAYCMRMYKIKRRLRFRVETLLKEFQV